MMSQPRVLLALESGEAREQLTEMLAGQPWELVPAESGDKALRIVEGDPPELVLLDAHLGGTNGFDVCRRLREDRRHHLLPVVMMGCDLLVDRVAAMDAGADDLLARPVEQSELIARVRSLLRLKSLYDRLEEARRVIFALAKAAEAKDPFTLYHAERVADMACTVAERLGLPADTVDRIRVGALVHDVGKISVPDAILHKPGPLTDEEFAAVQQHTLVGAQIVAPLAGQSELIAIVRSHHERIDGRGYPDGLAGDAIPVSAKIVAVCDAYDAMVNLRPYRPAMPQADAIAILTAGRGSQWDGRIVDVFARTINDG